MYILTLTVATLVTRFLSHSDGFLGDFSVTKQRISTKFIQLRTLTICASAALCSNDLQNSVHYTIILIKSANENTI